MTQIYMDMVATGGMPQMVFEYILKQHGLDPASDLSINQNIDFGSTAAAFSEGEADYTVEFEPGATSLESEGKRICRRFSRKRQRLCPIHCLQCKTEFYRRTS